MTKKKQKKLETLYKNLLSLEEKIKETHILFSERDELLKEIFERSENINHLDKGVLLKVQGDLRLLEVVEQNGHYVYHRPLRLSNKRADPTDKLIAKSKSSRKEKSNVKKGPLKIR